MRECILEMSDIIKEFPGVMALKGVTFKVNEGEILSLVGENGAGKSTLMKILSGAYPYGTYRGRILVNGEEKKFLTPKDSEKSGIEMIYQEISSILDLSVAENIFVGDYPKNIFGIVDWGRVYSETEELLERIGLRVRPRETMRNLNTSEQQLVAIAKALRKNPRILVLDEPTSTLTLKETENLFKIIFQFKSKGISCVYISHKLDEVFRISDRIVVLRDGESQGEFRRENFNHKDIVTSMVGRKIENMFPKEKADIGDAILQIENMNVQHPYNKSKNIISNVSFCVRKGEILGLAGLVGSGRSELVNAIFGDRKLAYTGKVYIEGKEAVIKSPADALKNGIALVTEDRKKNGIVGIMNIKENVTLASLKQVSRLGVMNHSKEAGCAKKYKEDLRIKANHIETKVFNLSGGNQQKVVLSKWLNTLPKVLILDEPTRGIDVGAKVEIYNLMCSLAKAGVAIIMISSELPELFAMCDRFVVLGKGEVRAEMEKEAASENSIMMAATCAD